VVINSPIVNAIFIIQLFNPGSSLASQHQNSVNCSKFYCLPLCGREHNIGSPFIFFHCYHITAHPAPEGSNLSWWHYRPISESMFITLPFLSADYKMRSKSPTLSRHLLISLINHRRPRLQKWLQLGALIRARRNSYRISLRFDSFLHSLDSFLGLPKLVLDLRRLNIAFLDVYWTFFQPIPAFPELLWHLSTFQFNDWRGPRDSPGPVFPTLPWPIRMCPSIAFHGDRSGTWAERWLWKLSWFALKVNVAHLKVRKWYKSHHESGFIRLYQFPEYRR
jgi:hypothetical protein